MSQPSKPPPDNPDPHAPFRRIYLLALAISLPLLLLLPSPAPLIIAAALVLVTLAALADDRDALLKIVRLDLPRIATPPRLYIAEIAVILVVLALATRGLQNFSPLERLRGHEFSYLINSGVIAADGFHQTGILPLWNPYMGRGEPLIENPFSFVLNPLMTLPIFAFGAIQGTKVAVLLHIGLMGVGGWLLGSLIGMKTPGRLLLALLLGGSGSFVAPLGTGFYQMSLSQTYVPWVYAALFGIITRSNWRRWAALFAVSGALLIFAGTFWYALPTALDCGLLVAFHAFRRNGSRRIALNTAMLARVAVAGLLLVGLAAARLLPQAIHRNLIEHPLETLDYPPDSLSSVLLTFVTPTVVPPFLTPAIHYHYVIPFGLLALLVFGRLAFPALGAPLAGRWRIVAPALIMIALCVAWAQGDAFTRWLYATFPLVREWRFVGRMLTAAAPWIGVLTALWLDQLAVALWQALAIPGARLFPRLRLSLRLSKLTASILLFIVLIISARSVGDVLTNWRDRSGTEANGFLERAPLAYLREQNPDAFLAVQTSSFFGYIPFYENRIRATFGNPDYRPLSVEPTVGTRSAMDFPPPDALGLSSPQFHDYLRSAGFEPMPAHPDGLFGANVLWHNPTAPAHVFTVREDVLRDRQAPLDASLTHPVDFVHKFDVIEAFPAGYEAGSLLVAQETAYPGWQVSIDGAPAPIESVGGLIGVRLPPATAGAPLRVEFAYRPAWLYLGAAITLLSSGILVVFVLRIGGSGRRRGLPA